jgi:hypothetical protein
MDMKKEDIQQIVEILEIEHQSIKC